MKKYILLTLILSVVVIGPFAYQQWSEAKRLRHIRETKQLASQIHATSLVDYLHQLKHFSPDSTQLLLFTGNTQAQLEPCGCFIGQSGGLPRRAEAISRIRENGFFPLLVDLGGIQSSQPTSKKTHALASVGSSADNEVMMRDQHRMQTTFTAMEIMGYNAFFPFDAETEIVQNREVDLSFTFLNSDLTHDSNSYLIKTDDEKSIGVIGLNLKDLTQIEFVYEKLNSLMSEVQEKCDFIVGLSHSSPEVNKELAREYPSFSAILSPYEGETEKIGRCLIGVL